MQIKTKKIILWICALIILIPLIVNLLLLGRLPIVFGDDWQGFFGEYFGAIIGGLTAYLLLQLQRDNNEQDDAKRNRSFVYIEDYKGHYRLKGAELAPDTKLIETEEYKTFVESRKKEELEQGTLAFYKIGHKGYGETIFNCKVRFVFKGIDEEQKKHPFEKSYNLPMLSKGEEIYLPFIFNDFNEFEINSINITYKTMANEFIIFEHDLDNFIETYYSSEVSHKNKILVSPIKTINWILPMHKR